MLRDYAFLFVSSRMAFKLAIFEIRSQT